jgi:trans-aconitate 2-methyltransferase
VGATQTIGIDASVAFLDEARSTRRDLTFVHADLAVDPLPPADLVFARYLLSHLPDPERRVDEWRRSLRPGGRLLIEENTGLRITHPVFRRYEDAVAVVMDAGGGDLYVGERLAAVADLVTRTTVAPPAGVVARLFGMNLVTWRDHPAAVGLDVGGLADDLRALEASAETGLVRFDLAQLVVLAAEASA